MATVEAMIARLRSGQQRVEPPFDRILVNGQPADLSREIEAGDDMEIGSRWFRIIQGLEGFLYPAPLPAEQVGHPVRLHAGLQGCLTEFSRKLYQNAAAARLLSGRWGTWRPPVARHFDHEVDAFHAGLHRARIQSLSGIALDLDAYDDIQIVRFVRDPRDLLVSGYHAHRTGAEPWTRIANPTPADYAAVNGGIPTALAGGPSLRDYLEFARLADGMAAELEFRRPHFQSMMAWPADDDRILTFRYEEILGNEADIFGQIADHFDWGRFERRAAARVASAVGRDNPVRDAAPGQWREAISAELNEAIIAEFGPILRAHDYPLE